MAQLIKKSKEEKAIRRIENIKEDEDLEINPYLFTEASEEEDVKMGDKKFYGLHTIYSPEYYNYLYDNLFYMGHTYVINKDLMVHAADPRWLTFKDSRKTSVVRDQIVIQPSMKCQYESLESVPGLLNLPEYIKSRVFDIAFSLCSDDMADLPPDQLELEEKDIMDPKRLGAIKINIKRFMSNNTFTFYSQDRTSTFTMFCPLIAAPSNGYCVIKFLRVMDGEIDSKIYMILLRDVDDIIQKRSVELETGEVIDFYIKLGSKHAGTNHYSSIGYYDAQSSELTSIDLPDEEPVDCVVCSMVTCGFLIQPDLTRYHNLFRSIYKEKETTMRFNAITQTYQLYKVQNSLSVTLSHGYTEFINKIITSRIKSFYNFENPSSPLKTISMVTVFLKNPSAGQLDPKSMAKYTKKKINNITYYQDRDNPKDIYTYGCDKASLYKVLNELGLNHENCFIICGIPMHQLMITYRKGEYVMVDSQVNEIYTYDQYIDHPNMKEDDSYFLSFNVITTSEPREAILHGPEYPTLFDHMSHTYKYDGDIMPSIKNTVNHFSIYPSGRPIHEPPLQPVQGRRNVEMILDRLDLFDTKSRPENIQREIDTLHYENLCIMRYPNPAYSFQYYNKLERLLTHLRDTFATTEGLRGLRRFITKFYTEIGEEVSSRYGTFLSSLKRGFGFIYQSYSDKDVYNLLLQRPVFSATARECLRLNVCKVGDLIDRIVEYLHLQNKPVLQTSGLFYSIIDRATKEGIDQSIIRFLSRFREIKLSTLDQLSSRILAQLDTNHIELSLYQTLKALAKPSDEIIKQAKALVKSQLAIDVVTSRVTAKTIMQYAQIHRETLLKPSLLIDDVEEYVDPQFSRELVDLALHEFLSAKSLSYHQQPIEDRKAVTRALIERIRNQREFDEPIVRTRLQMMKREREKERTSKRLQRGLDEEEEVKLRAIRNVLEAMIEEKEDELQQIDWSDAKYAKMLQERVSELERFYHTENDRLDAFDVFISVMNIIKHKNIQLSKKYLGYRK